MNTDILDTLKTDLYTTDKNFSYLYNYTFKTLLVTELSDMGLESYVGKHGWDLPVDTKLNELINTFNKDTPKQNKKAFIADFFTYIVFLDSLVAKLHSTPGGFAIEKNSATITYSYKNSTCKFFIGRLLTANCQDSLIFTIADIKSKIDSKGSFGITQNWISLSIYLDVSFYNKNIVIKPQGIKAPVQIAMWGNKKIPQGKVLLKDINLELFK